MGAIFNKIENIILLGIKVSFKTSLNQIVVSMKKDKKKLTQVLPFDHIREEKICDLLNWMRNEILKEDELH